MRRQVTEALSTTTAHGLPRVVSSKPVAVRIAWLLLCLTMSCLFLKSFCEFVVKLQSRRVTTSIESNAEKFQFPDVYMCFENPISGSYSANIDAATAAAIDASFNASMKELLTAAKRRNSSGDGVQEWIRNNSYLLVQSLPFQLLFDSLAHRFEQSVISSHVGFVEDTGEPSSLWIEPEEFNHPLYLRCLKWTISSSVQEKMAQSESWAGLTVTVLLDASSVVSDGTASEIQQSVYIPDGTVVPTSDWSLSISRIAEADRLSAVKLFLTPHGEYPTDFVRSFFLGPGKHHSVEIEMTQRVSLAEQFHCRDNEPDVQFTNPYDLSPYNHSYSYSYCYYYEHHRLLQKLFNLSGLISPLPSPLKNSQYFFNLTKTPNFLSLKIDSSAWKEQEKFTRSVLAACEQKYPCRAKQYRERISSADWPTHSSLAPFVNSSVRRAWMRAKARNLSVPALDFLMTGNASDVATYVRNNLLKVHLKASSALCDRVTFSIEYGLSSFISEVGGSMGIYLGMSLLTLCELLELAFSIAAACFTKANLEKCCRCNRRLKPV